MSTLEDLDDLEQERKEEKKDEDKKDKDGKKDGNEAITCQDEDMDYQGHHVRIWPLSRKVYCSSRPPAVIEFSRKRPVSNAAFFLNNATYRGPRGTRCGQSLIVFPHLLTCRLSKKRQCCISV